MSFKAIVLFLLIFLTSCGEPYLVENAFLDLWCGSVLCAWHTDTGEIEKIPTWHKRDYAAKMTGETVVISQSTKEASYYDNEPIYCAFFNLLANAEKGAKLYLDVIYPASDTAMADYLAYVKVHPEISTAELTTSSDVIEWASTQEIPSNSWKQSNLEIQWPPTFENVRIIVRKAGKPDAVIARIAGLANTDCGVYSGD